MKRFISKICILFLCGLIVSLPFVPSKVGAAEVTDPGFVLAQSVVKDGNYYYSSNAVYQNLYTDREFLGTADKEKIIVKTKPQTKYGVSDTKLCSTFGNDSRLCNNGKPKGALATLKIINNGSVVINAANEVDVTGVEFYYILATHSGDAHLFCDTQGTICNNAKYLGFNSSGAHGLWNQHYKQVSFNYSSKKAVEEAFPNKKENQTGAIELSGFNIFDKIPSNNYVSIAQRTGLYILANMRISYEGKDYYTNAYTVSENLNFKTVGNLDNSEKKNILICDGAQSCVHTITEVSKLAALVMPDTNRDPTKNKAFIDAINFFEETIKPIVYIVIGILFVVVGTSFGINIVKSGDEPEVRKENIHRLVGLFVGVFVLYMILTFYRQFIDIFIDIM